MTAIKNYVMQIFTTFGNNKAVNDNALVKPGYEDYNSLTEEMYPYQH